MFTGRAAAQAGPGWRSELRAGLVVSAQIATSLAGCAAPEVAATQAVSETGQPGSATAQPEVEPARIPPVRDVVVISIDTLRWDALGFAGNPRVETPTLDRLAQQGWVFDQARAHATNTLPSHASLLTGLLPYEHGIRDNIGFVLDSSIPTLATVLSAAGFRTGAAVAAFPLDRRFGLARGFDAYDDSYAEGGSAGFEMAERSGRDVVSAGLSWWRSHQGERRFLFLHLYDPHAPYAPPAPWDKEYADAAYLGEVAAVDAFLEPLLEPFLNGNEEPALIVFTSDHGEGLGDHGELTHGLFAYDSTLKVPLVVWRTGLEPLRVSRPVAHVDVMPTVLGQLGLEIPERLTGRSLLEESSPSDPVRDLYFEALEPALNRGWAPLRGLYRHPWKMVDLPIPELYDLAQDPDEKSNLARRRRPQLSEMLERLPKESSWPPTAGSELSDADARALRSLGYLSGGKLPERRDFGPADDPKNLVEVDAQIHRFMAAHAMGRESESLRLARQIVESQPHMATAHYHLALVLLEQGKTREALDGMVRAYRADVASPLLLRQLALTLAEVGQAPQAMRVLQPLLESNDPDTLNAFALVASEAGQLDEAEQALERVFRADSRNPEGHQNRALVALRREDWPGCLEQADRALELNPALPLAWNYRGIAHYNLGQKGQAVDDWQRAVDLAPKDFDLLYNLATVAAEIGRRDLARESLQRFITQAPPDRYSADIQRAKQRLGQLGG